MRHFFLSLGIYLLETLFALGIIGTVVVIILVTIDDIRDLRKPDEPDLRPIAKRADA